jgi:hypothetical protein
MVPSSAESVPAHLRLRDLITSGVLAKAVAVLCELGVPDALSVPRTNVELAKEVGADAEALLPFLRAGCAGGVLTEPRLHVFELTSLGQLLREDHEASEKALCLLVGREEFDQTYAKANQSTRAPQPMFEVAFGKPFFQYLSTDPEFAAVYNAAMVSSNALENLLAACDFSNDRHIVDLGGGLGAVLSEILRRNPNLRGTLVDLPHVVAGAGPVLAENGVADRVTVVPASFFDHVPDTGDVYLLSRVIGNWGDAESLRLLRTIRAAMDPGDRLIIVGNMPSENDRTNYPVQLSFFLFAMMGARTRTYDEYAELLGQSDLTVSRWANFPDGESIIEAVPA